MSRANQLVLQANYFANNILNIISLLTYYRKIKVKIFAQNKCLKQLTKLLIPRSGSDVKNGRSSAKIAR